MFDLVQVLTGGGPAGSTESIALYAYLNGMRFLDFGYSATVMLAGFLLLTCLLYTSPSPRDGLLSRMPSSA